MDFPILTIWMSLLSILGTDDGVVFHFYLIFRLKSRKQTEKPHRVLRRPIWGYSFAYVP